MRVALIAALLSLTSCASSEEWKAEQLAAEVAECKALGFKEGTEELGNCRLQLRAIEMQRFMAVFTGYQGVMR
jgi:hypothetical protein